MLAPTHGPRDTAARAFRQGIGAPNLSPAMPERLGECGSGFSAFGHALEPEPETAPMGMEAAGPTSHV